MRTLPLLAAVLLSPLAGAVGRIANPSHANPPFPGGLLDSTGRTAFVTTRTGIEAVDLARGDVLWRTKLASRPLLVAGDRLYALAIRDTRLCIRGFDLAGKGEKVFESAAIDLPRWVKTRNGLGHSFTYRWQQDRNSLLLTWHATAAAEGGARKETAGLASVDLESGRVRHQSVPVPNAAATPRIPAQLEKLAVRWQRSLAGQLLALVVEDLPGSRPGQRQQRFVLRSWNERTGKENPARELLRGRRLVVLPAMDDRHLWLRDAMFSPDEPNSAAPFAGRHWSVFAAVDGHLVARVPFVPGTRSAVVLGDRAYCLTAGAVRATLLGNTRSGRVLHAVDLTTGKVVWSRRGLLSNADSQTRKVP